MTGSATNGYEPFLPHIAAMEDIEAELDALKIDYMNACREKREAQKRRIKMVKAEGFSVVPFKAVLEKRKLSRKIGKIDEKMAEVDETETYEMMQSALGMLGDLPLGKAVLEKARERKKKNAADVDDLAGEKRVADNVTALTAGINPLN